MGSIPLVALNVKTPEQPDLLQKYGQLMQLKNMQQQSQLQQQEAPLRLQALQQGVQTGGLQLQQQQRALQDQQAKTAALGEWDGSDINKLYPLILKHGGSSDAVMSLKSQVLEQQQKAAVAFKDTADGGKAQVETVKQKGDLIAGALSPLVDPAKVPDAQLPQALTATVQDLVAKQLLDPQHAQAATQLLQSGNPQQIRQGIDQFVKTGMAQSQILQNAHVEAQTAQAQAAPVQAAANAAETARHNAVDERAAAQRISLEGARLAFDRQRQGTQDESAIEAQAQQIANGDVKGLSQARQNPFARAVMARVYEINPKYSDSLYTATQDLRSSKPNSMGGNVGRLGTAILHADNALKESNNLGFSEGLLTGIPTAGTAGYKQAAEFLTGEIGQYVTGGKLTVDEGKKLSSDLMSSRQGVRDSALHKIIDLSSGKLKSQMEQFKNATQTDFPTDRVFNDPDIKGALQNHGVIGGNSQGNNSSGGTIGGQSTMITPSFGGKLAPGMVAPGNIDLSKRPNIDNGDGTRSSVFSMGVNIDGKELLIPGVGDGKTYPLRKLTTKEAVDQYRKTGANLGTFASPQASDRYAQTLHEDQARGNSSASGGFDWNAHPVAK